MSCYLRAQIDPDQKLDDFQRLELWNRIRDEERQEALREMSPGERAKVRRQEQKSIPWTYAWMVVKGRELGLQVGGGKTGDELKALLAGAGVVPSKDDFVDEAADEVADQTP
jgi:hypothetical protein